MIQGRTCKVLYYGLGVGWGHSSGKSNKHGGTLDVMPTLRAHLAWNIYIYIYIGG